MPLLGSRGAASLTGFGGLANLGYFLRNSLRFRASNNAKLTRTPGSASNRKTYTISAWVKFGESDSVIRTIFCAGDSSGSTATHLYIYASQIRFYFGGAGGPEWRATQLLRDPAAWYHIVAAVDTNQGTLDDKLKLYVNGTRVTSWVSQNSIGVIDTQINNTVAHALGSNAAANQYLYDGYMAEFNFIDGQQLTPSSFAKTDAVTGQWVPKKFGGAYGTNGFYLNFNDNSAATAAAIGKDSSGNGNNYTPSGISVTTGTTYDSMTDVPTLTNATTANYCTFNPLTTTGGTFSDGNLVFNGGGTWRSINGTFAFPTSGQWYFEATLTSAPYSPRASNTSYNWIGVGLATNFNSTSAPSDTNINGFLWGDNGFINNFTSSPVDSTVSLSNGDVMRFGIDTTNNTYTLYKNAGLVASSTFNVTAGTQLVPYHSSYSTAYGAMAVNFGQRPFAYPTTSGAFSGYKALNTYNLP
jgi:hypothetical protein